MYYECSQPTALSREEKSRRRISMLVFLCLYSRIPAWTVQLAGSVTGNRARVRLASNLIQFVSNPDGNYAPSIHNWALSYAGPGIIRRLIGSLAKLENNEWWRKILSRADPDLLLPQEHTTPGYQVMHTSSGTPESALVCFTGNAQRLNMPVQLFHCAVASKFDLLIYLRDPKKQCFSSGVKDLGITTDKMLESLRRRVPVNCRVSIVGTSSGGIAAARLADSLRARRLALFSPSFEFKGVRATGSGGLDNVDAVKVFLARHNMVDQKLAVQWQASVAAPKIEWLDAHTHGTLTYLADIGRLNMLIDWLAE